MQRSSASPTSYEVSRNERRPHCRSDTAGLCRRVDSTNGHDHLPPFTAEDRDGSGHRRFRGEVSVTLFVISAALPVVVWGRLADRLGRRTALLSSLVLFVIACIALALVQSAAVLLIGRIVQGIGAGGAAIIVRMMVKDKFTGSELASRLSLLSMAFVVALGGGQLIGGALASFTSWRTGFGVLGVLGAALAAVALRTENTTVRDNNERVVRWNAIVLTPQSTNQPLRGAWVSAR